MPEYINEGRILQLFAALTIIGVALAAAMMIGADSIVIAIMLAMGVLLLFVMRDSNHHYDAPPPPQMISTEPREDLLANPGFVALVDSLAQPVLLIERGRVARANGEALKLLGNHIMGQDVRIAIRHPAVAEHLAGSERLSGPAKIDIVGLGTKNQRWAMQIIPLDDVAGQQRMFVHMIDESGTYAADRARGDFVANASHELRTPLAAILGFVETLQDPETGDDREVRARFLSILENEARRMQQLVDDLMSLSRIEADKHRMPQTEINMDALVDDVVQLCRQNLSTRGGDIVVETGDGLPNVQGDTTQISQLLHNLVSNSAKYGRAGTPIIVRVAPAPPSMIRLEVSDEGEGIAPDHLPRLTERFYRVDSGRSRSIGGTGLGLAIVKHIVERHRGRLDISSIPGRGTTVSILLPAVTVPETA